ncbi:MAG: HAD-IB family phosphatase [Planctomycetota bacterium]
MRPRLPPPYDLVAFDCDSTLSTIEGIDELGRGVTGVAELTDRAMAGEVALEDVYALRLERIAPTLSEVEAIGARYVATAVPGAVELVGGLLALGKRVVIVSGGLREAILPLADHLGVARADVHAVDVRFDANGRYAGLAEHAPLARAGGKPAVVEPLVRGLRAALVGDGATDLEARPAVDRFVAYAGVERRAAVVAGADASIEHLDLLAAAPLLLAPEERARLARLGRPGFGPVA